MSDVSNKIKRMHGSLLGLLSFVSECPNDDGSSLPTVTAWHASAITVNPGNMTRKVSVTIPPD